MRETNEQRVPTLDEVKESFRLHRDGLLYDQAKALLDEVERLELETDVYELRLSDAKQRDARLLERVKELEREIQENERLLATFSLPARR